MKYAVPFLFVILFLAACGKKADNPAKDSVDSIELVQVNHPYLGGRISVKRLDDSKIADFLNDFANKKEGIVKFYSCYVLKIHLKGGQTLAYRTNGKNLELMTDDSLTTKFFVFNSDSNLITKYWEIPKKIFCKDNSRESSVDSLTEDEIFEMVMALPEVKERSAYVDKESKGERHLAALLYASPDANDNYYWVKVGEDNGFAFVTHFHFYVYPNRSIRYYDAANDTVMDLSDWRERLKASSDKSKILN